MNLIVDHWPVCFMILLSSLLLMGLRALVDAALPGDQEMLDILNTIREKETYTHQQSRHLIDELARLALQEVQTATGKGKV